MILSVDLSNIVFIEFSIHLYGSTPKYFCRKALSFFVSFFFFFFRATYVEEFVLRSLS